MIDNSLIKVLFDFREICESLLSSGNLEWTDKTKRRAFIYWKSPSQIGADIYK